MKSFRIIALSVLVTVCTFCAVMYSSCKKDGCKGVTCLNMGTCTGGICSCPTGYTGVTCQTLAILGNWTGSDTCSASGNDIMTVTATSDSTGVLVTSPATFGSDIAIPGTLSNGTMVTYAGAITSKIWVKGTLTLGSNTSLASAYSVTDTAGKTVVRTCGGTYNPE